MVLLTPAALRFTFERYHDEVRNAGKGMGKAGAMFHSPAFLALGVQDLRLVLTWPEPPREVQVVWSQYAAGNRDTDEILAQIGFDERELVAHVKVNERVASPRFESGVTEYMKGEITMWRSRFSTTEYKETMTDLMGSVREDRQARRGGSKGKGSYGSGGYGKSGGYGGCGGSQRCGSGKGSGGSQDQWQNWQSDRSRRDSGRTGRASSSSRTLSSRSRPRRASSSSNRRRTTTCPGRKDAPQDAPGLEVSPVGRARAAAGSSTETPARPPMLIEVAPPATPATALAGRIRPASRGMRRGRPRLEQRRPAPAILETSRLVWAKRGGGRWVGRGGDRAREGSSQVGAK